MRSAPVLVYARPWVHYEGCIHLIGRSWLGRRLSSGLRCYKRIFARCGVDAVPVEADSGAIGGDVTHEFMVLADSGEDLVLHCESCGYAANVERAEGVPSEKVDAEGQWADCEEVATPGASTIDQITAFLNVEAMDCIKTLIYKADGKPVAVLVRGDHNLNEIKFQKLLKCDVLELADEETICSVTGGPLGFSGPVGLEIPYTRIMLWDAW